MTNYSNDDKNQTLDIPNFEDKGNTTTSTSIDMSIFKMSDDELYEELPKTNSSYVDSGVFDDEPKKKKKSGKGALIVLLIIALLAAAAGAFFAFKEHKAATEANEALAQSQAQVAELQTKVNDLTSTVENLTKQIEDMNKKKPVYEVVDGPISFRSEANKNGAETTYNGEDFAWDGEQFEALEVVVDTDDSSYSWIKVAENVYFCIGTEAEPWASVVEDVE